VKSPKKVAVLLLLLQPIAAQAASRSEARALLNDGKRPLEAVEAYESFSSSTDDATLVAERSLALAAAGLNQAALQEMDRAFLLDPTADEVLFAGSTLLAWLGLVDAATELARPVPDWITRQPLLPPRKGSRPQWDAPPSMGTSDGALRSASELMQRGRYITAADRLGRAVASNPKDPMAWSGYAIALENLGAYHSAARAVAAELYLAGNSSGGEDRRLLEEHKAELERRLPLARPEGIENALAGRYTLFAGGSLSGGNGSDTIFTVQAQAGKFLTNRFNVLLSTGYAKSTGVALSAGGRYYQPLGTAPVRFTAGSRLEFDTGASSDKLSLIASPGLSWFIRTSSLDLVYDWGLTGSLKGAKTATVGFTMYFGGSS
jgi:tetratricopeptide (TPR) repeat protein